eukprot:3269412-Pyramimonas_sp.AAC.2
MHSLAAHRPAACKVPECWCTKCPNVGLQSVRMLACKVPECWRAKRKLPDLTFAGTSRVQDQAGARVNKSERE